jgi:hypothetical protein
MFEEHIGTALSDGETPSSREQLFFENLSTTSFPIPEPVYSN